MIVERLFFSVLPALAACENENLDISRPNAFSPFFNCYHTKEAKSEAVRKCKVINDEIKGEWIMISLDTEREVVSEERYLMQSAACIHGKDDASTLNASFYDDMALGKWKVHQSVMSKFLCTI